MLGRRALEMDKFSRMLSIKESAQIITDKMSSEVKEFLQAYADGINDGRKSLRMLPVEFLILGVDFHEWSVYDSITFGKYLSILNTNNAFHEFMRTTLDTLYGRNSSDILGCVGSDN